MTVNLSQKNYMQLLEATRGHPIKIFQTHIDIFVEGWFMSHKAACATHLGMRCGCHPEIEGTNKMA